jgi:outer membrane protein assembly factor BamD
LYFLALSYHDLGADDWASEQLTLLAQKYPDSKHAGEGASLLAKIGGSAKPATLLAKKPEPASSAERTTTSSSPEARTAPAGGVTPQVANGLMRLPSAAALGQGFVTCRLGAWC